MMMMMIMMLANMPCVFFHVLELAPDVIRNILLVVYFSLMLVVGPYRPTCRPWMRHGSNTVCLC